MTAPDPIDLDHLDALYAAATPGYSGAFGDKGLRYRMRDGVHEVSGCNRYWLSTYIADFSDSHDAKLYIALHNAWPAISAELRRLRAELRRMAEWYDAIADTIPGDAAGPHFGVVEWVRQLVANARALAIEELTVLNRWVSGYATDVASYVLHDVSAQIDARISALRAGDAANAPKDANPQ